MTNLIRFACFLSVIVVVNLGDIASLAIYLRLKRHFATPSSDQASQAEDHGVNELGDLPYGGIYMGESDSAGRNVEAVEMQNSVPEVEG